MYSVISGLLPFLHLHYRFIPVDGKGNDTPWLSGEGSDSNIILQVQRATLEKMGESLALFLDWPPLSLNPLLHDGVSSAVSLGHLELNMTFFLLLNPHF
jgi:hypothetical protein